MMGTKMGTKSRRIAGAVAALIMAGIGPSAIAASDNASIEGVILGTYQNASQSKINGQNVNDELSAQLYLYGTLKMGPGTWNLEIRGSTTPTDNGVTTFYESNALIGETLDSDGNGRIAVTQLFYEFPLGSGKLRAGLLDPAAVLDTNDVQNTEYEQFMADAFVNNPTISMPSFALGAAWQADITPSVGFKAFVSSDSGLEDADHSYHNVFDLGADRDGHAKGVFTAAELGWHANGFALTGGAWYDSGAVDRLTAAGSTHAYGLYLLAGAPAGSGRVQARAGIANRHAQAAANFVSLAYQRPIQLASRKTTLGIAVARTGVSDELADTDPVYQAEAYWRINVAGSFYVSPDLQYISHAGFDPRLDGTLIGGVRVGLTF